MMGANAILPNNNIVITRHVCVNACAPNLVLVHGWGFSSYVWRLMLPVLNKRFNVFVVDLPGYGEAAFTKGDYCIDKLLDDLLALVPSCAVYCGWSMGANIITSLAAREPQRLQAIVALASSPSFLQRNSFPGMRQTLFKQFAMQLENQGAAFLRRFAGVCAKGDEQEKELWRALKVGLNTQAGHLQGLVESLQLTASLDNRHIVKSLTMPQYFLLAENDAVTDVNVCKALSFENINSRCEVIEQASHALLLSHAEVLSDKIIRFCEDNHCLSKPAVNNKIKISQAFACAANTYDEVADLQRNVATKLFGFLPDYKSCQHVLDLGSGTGYAMPFLFKRYPNARLTQLDVALPMLKVAQEKDVDQRAAFVQADFDCLPLREQSVDVIFSSLALQWSSDLEQTLTSCFRVLKPGGYLVFASLLDQSLLELKTTWHNINMEYKHVNDFLSEQQFTADVHDSAFCVSHIERDVHTQYFSDVRGLMRSFKKIGAKNINPQRARGLLGKRQWAQVNKSYEQKRTSQGLPLSYDVVYCVLQKGVAQ